MPSSAAFESFTGKLPFFKALSPMQKASSAACDSVSGKLPSFRALSLQCKRLVISCLHSFSGKPQSSRISLFNTKSSYQLPLIQSAERFLFSRLSLSIQKALHQLPSIRSAESFLFSRLSLSMQNALISCIQVVQRKASFLQGSLSKAKGFISCR